MAGDPRILDNLPDDGRPWRLTYVGGITQIGGRQTPMVRLHFAPYIGRTRTRSSLLSNRSYDWSSAKVIEAGVSDLAYFTIGSLWTAGTPEAYPGYEEITVDVDVVHDTTAPGACAIYPGDGVGPHGNHIIPPGYYRVPPEIAEGRVVVFPMRSPFRGLIIPCSEIFRFYYYGVSGKLGRALLDGTYMTHRGLIVSEGNCKKPDPFGYAYVRLGKRIDDEDAFEMARIQFSPEANYEAGELLKRAIAGRNGNIYPLEIRPPFSGRVRWTVRGKRMLIGKYWAFFAFAIMKCSAPMPFTLLGFNRQNPSTQGRKPTAETKIGYAGSYKEAVQPDDLVAAKMTQRVDPSSRDVTRKVEGVMSRDRYTAAFRKMLVDRGPLKVRSASVLVDVMAPNAVYASGAGAAGSAARAAAWSEGDPRGLPSLLANFKNTLAFLKSAPTVVVSSIDDRVFAARGDGSARAWAFIDSYARLLPRRVVVASVILGGRPFVVLELERRPGSAKTKEEYFRTLFLSPPGARAITKTDILDILDHLTTARGVIDGVRWRGGPFDAWAVDGHRHADPDPLKRAQTLFNALIALRIV